MIQVSQLCQAVETWFRSNRRLAVAIPGGLWIAGTVPSSAVSPYASFTVTESDPETGSNYVIRRFDLVVSVWSDNAQQAAGNVASILESWLTVSPERLPIIGGRVVRVKTGSSETETEPTPRNANDVTVTRLKRRITTEEN